MNRIDMPPVEAHGNYKILVLGDNGIIMTMPKGASGQILATDSNGNIIMQDSTAPVNIRTSVANLQLTGSPASVKYYTYTGNTNGTWTLPPMATSGKSRFFIINTSNSDLTLNTSGGENTLWESGMLVNNLSIMSGEVYNIYNNEANFVILN